MNTHAKYPKSILCTIALPVALLATLAGGPAWGDNVVWDGETSLDYNVNDNWDPNFVPAHEWDEVAVINNDDPNPVFLEDDLRGQDLKNPAGLNVNTGGLEIRSGGALEVLQGELSVDPPPPPGDVTVGTGGTLTVLGSGILTAVGTASLNGNTRLVGPNATFSAGSFTLGSGHVLTAEITDPVNQAPLSTAGTATVRGSVVVEFNGVAPVEGNSWNLIDAATIDGAFTTPAVPIGPGLALFFETVAGGTNGQVVRASVANQLQLTVNFVTGSMAINNLSTTSTEDIDGYSITSNGNDFDLNNWVSFEADGQAGWLEANPMGNHLGELNLDGSRVIDTGPISLGTPVRMSEFGMTPELTFEYTKPTDETRSGQVEITGYNTLVLLVDTASGETAIKNDSNFDVRIDGYSITSEDENLDEAAWTSVAPGDANWQAANLAPFHLGELNLNGSLEIPAGTVISIGNAYDETGNRTEDLEFQFDVVGNGGPLPADFNGDDKVDGDDLPVWEAAFGVDDSADADGDGDSDGNDFLAWQSTLGATGSAGGVYIGAVEYLTGPFTGGSSGAGASAVPEPGSLALLLLMLPVLACRRMSSFRRAA
jgi:hypothetical protein